MFRGASSIAQRHNAVAIVSIVSIRRCPTLILLKMRIWLFSFAFVLRRCCSTFSALFRQFRVWKRKEIADKTFSLDGIHFPNDDHGGWCHHSVSMLNALNHFVHFVVLFGADECEWSYCVTAKPCIERALSHVQCTPVSPVQQVAANVIQLLTISRYSAGHIDSELLFISFFRGLQTGIW